jgi:tRNA 2-thiouridine synthesizing protein A
MMEFNQEVDARGLNCPLPLLRAKKSLSAMSSGQLLKVLATDRGSVRDFQTFCKHSGNQLVSSSARNGEFLFYIKKR